GANVLTIMRSTANVTPHFRLFTIGSGVTVSISGLTVSNGHTDDGLTASSSSFLLQGVSGGGIRNAGTLTLTNVRVTGNSTGNGNSGGQGGPGGQGGGVAHSALLTMTDCTISGNMTGQGAVGAGSGGGGGILGVFYPSGTLVMKNSVVTGNRTASGNINGSR